jgi:hypothetical protein
VRAFPSLCDEPNGDTSLPPEALDLLNKLASLHVVWDSRNMEEQPEIRLKSPSETIRSFLFQIAV